MTQLELLKLRRRSLPLERATHIALADLLAWRLRPGWLSQHIPSGEKRDKATGALLLRMGHRPGWADFVLVDPKGRHFYLELKRGSAPQNPHQIEFGHAMLARGVPYALARSYDEAEAILDGWGALRARARP